MPDSELLTTLKSRKLPSYDFDFAEVWQDNFFTSGKGKNAGKFKLQILTHWQTQQALSEAHLYLADFIAGHKEQDLRMDLKEHVLMREFIQWAYVLAWAIQDPKGHRVFLTGKDLLLVVTQIELEILYHAYQNCEYLSHPTVKKEYDSEDVLRLGYKLAKHADSDLPNQALAGIPKTYLEELLIRMSMIMEGCGVFNQSGLFGSDEASREDQSAGSEPSQPDQPSS